MKTIHVHCPLCDFESSTVKISGVDRLIGGTHAFTLRFCDNCSMLYLDPRPDVESIPLLYPDSYRPYGYLRSRFRQIFRHIRLRIRAALIVTRLKPGGTILEIGCGDGELLAEMQRRSFKVKGIELNQAAAARAVQKYGFDIEVGTFTQAKLVNDSFDAIILYHVLEHLIDPLEVLKKLKKTLKCGAVLVIGTPNSDSLEARIFGNHWVGYDLPRHLFTFSEKKLVETLKNMGFKDIVTVHEIDTNSWMLSINWRLQASSGPGKKWLFRLLSPLFFFLVFPLALFQAVFRISGKIIVFARK